MVSKRERLFNSIAEDLKSFSVGQLIWVDKISKAFLSDIRTSYDPESDLITEAIADYFGNALLLHHCFSAESFSKDKFEYVFEQTFLENGMDAQRAPKGNPGRDITVNGVNMSLKTQADSHINKEVIHVSKFMEMGKGQWSDKQDELVGLRQRFLDHMTSYERILTLRTLNKSDPWRYELVEIPKKLLQEAEGGQLEMMFKSAQMPKPGYCRVFDEKGRLKFALYFDGGSERKLQIKGLRKDLCQVHAEWEFKVSR
ncbi:hypothetical protein JCM15519_38010 [Fundidesulfovibrio butyratiphilus]